MRLLHTLLVLSLLHAAAAAEVAFGGSQGSFPVFGPSAEREAFFAAQQEARAAELEAQRVERERQRERQAELERLELERDIAEAEARERDDTADVYIRCTVVAPDGDDTPRRSIPFPRETRDTRVTRTTPPLDPGPGRPGPYPVPPSGVQTSVDCLPWQPVVRPGTELSISVDRGNVSGSLTVRRPGLGFGLGF